MSDADRTQTAVIDFTESLARIMEEKGMSKADLARELGSTTPYITRVLHGNANFTLATMTKLAHAVGAVLSVRLAPQRQK